MVGRDLEEEFPVRTATPGETVLDVRGMTAPRLRPRHDLASLLVYSAGAADVRDVWVAGRRIVKDRRACRVDRDGALAAGDALASRMAGSLA